jgi:putative oxidoreductase
MNITLRAGSILYALAVFAFGVEHFIYATPTARLIPAWIPWHLFWVYFVGVAFFASAISIIINKKARLACIMLGCMLILFIILIHVPSVYRDPGNLTNAFNDIGLASGAIILGGTFQKE